MKNLKELRKKRSSIASISKVIEAMCMISKSKFNYVSKQALDFRHYHKKFKQIMLDLLKDTILSPYKKPNNKHLLIVLTSDRGMCGGFNTSIVNYVKRFILNSKDENIFLLCVGKKGFTNLKNVCNVLHRTIAFEKVKFIDAQNICDDLNRIMKDNEIQRCSIIFTKFTSMFKQEIIREQILPIIEPDVFNALSKTVEKNDDDSDKKLFPLTSFEPNHDFIIEKLKDRTVITNIFYALLESAASEQAARMNAMENASKNARDMFKNLNLEYNRTRQDIITKEISEVVASTL